jgi:DNA polymerase-3 subunit alpha
MPYIVQVLWNTFQVLLIEKMVEEEFSYDLPEMAEYLRRNLWNYSLSRASNALSQKLAGFSKGDADVLRKAMGKKIFALLQN